MKTLDKSHDKIQKIADQLRRETLEPAQEESKAILAKAKADAENILNEARKEAEKIIATARAQLEQEKNVFQSSLEQASKQSVEALKQSIQTHLFNPQLEKKLKQEANDPKIVAKLILAMIAAIEKEGLSADLDVVVANSASAEEINHLLGQEILEKIKDKSVSLGDFEGGVKIKVLDQNLTLEMTDQTLMDLVSRYVRKDFRKLFF